MVVGERLRACVGLLDGAVAGEPGDAGGLRLQHLAAGQGPVRHVERHDAGDEREQALERPQAAPRCRQRCREHTSNGKNKFCVIFMLYSAY